MEVNKTSEKNTEGNPLDLNQFRLYLEHFVKGDASESFKNPSDDKIESLAFTEEVREVLEDYEEVLEDMYGGISLSPERYIESGVLSEDVFGVFSNAFYCFDEVLYEELFSYIEEREQNNPRFFVDLQDNGFILRKKEFYPTDGYDRLKLNNRIMFIQEDEYLQIAVNVAFYDRDISSSFEFRFSLVKFLRNGDFKIYIPEMKDSRINKDLNLKRGLLELSKVSRYFEEFLSRDF